MSALRRGHLTSFARTVVLPILVLAFAAGCGGEDRDDAAPEPASGSSASAVAKCVDRFLARVDPDVEADVDADALRRYLEETYCERFARRGWVYEDGALSIDAYRSVEAGVGEDCGEAEADGTTKTVPCDASAAEDGVLDCALLHHVRRSQVQAYLAELARAREVECDDGTAPEELGVP